MDTLSTEKPTVTRFGVAVSAYALSFGLVAVSTAGGQSVAGFWCAYYSLVILVGPIANSHFFDGKPSVYIPMLIYPWINIAFLASLAMRWWEGNRRPFKILRVITLLMVPSCWMLFYIEPLYPREGHVLWVAAMVLALFSSPTPGRTPISPQQIPPS